MPGLVVVVLVECAVSVVLVMVVVVGVVVVVHMFGSYAECIVCVMTLVCTKPDDVWVAGNGCVM